jgi:putative hydrolase of HD superfamily
MTPIDLDQAGARLTRQIDFVRALEQLKTVLRRNLVCDQSRRESAAEHSWQVALMAALLSEHAQEPVDLAKVVPMALVHDLVEIYAGDTFAYGDATPEEKDARERKAADEIFALLPEDQGQDLSALWQEFEAGKTAEAKFVRVLDRLQPVLLHGLTRGRVWKEHGVSRAQVLARVEEIHQNAPALWPVVCEIIDDAVREGWLQVP